MSDCIIQAKVYAVGVGCRELTLALSHMEVQMALTTIRFTVRNKGGKLGGETLEHQVAEFDWSTFKNTPNAEAFAKKAYDAEARRLIREIYEGNRQTSDHHLQSMESLIAKSLKFTREEIEEWCNSRDWRCAKFKCEPEKGIAVLKEHLPGLSSSEFRFPEKLRCRAAEIVAEVANINTDPVANYLFSKLTQDQMNNTLAERL